MNGYIACQMKRFATFCTIYRDKIVTFIKRLLNKKKRDNNTFCKI